MMRSLFHIAVAVALFGVNGSFIAGARAEDVPDKTPETAIVLALQAAIRSDDKEWFVSHLHYPVRYFGETDETIHSKDWFLAHYATVIGPELKANILAQDPEDYFTNYQGLMVGDGGRNIWFRDFGDPGAGVPSDYQIITINNTD